jgi:hypothetical protein
MRGEALDGVSRDSQVPAHELENWKRVFLETGTRGLKTRSDPEERELRSPKSWLCARSWPTATSGSAHRRTGAREQAQEQLTTATTMYREMGMTYWLEKAEAERGSWHENRSVR